MAAPLASPSFPKRAGKEEKATKARLESLRPAHHNAWPMLRDYGLAVSGLGTLGVQCCGSVAPKACRSSGALRQVDGLAKGGFGSVAIRG